MDKSQCRDMVDSLHAPFRLDEHEARKGGSGKWYIYVKKQSIIKRLNDTAPMDWHTRVILSARTDDRVEVVMEMTVCGISRSYDGAAEDNRRKGKDGKDDVLFPLNTAKAATTDAFKRVASMFGVGLYLQDCGSMSASDESRAMQAFGNWYDKEFNSKAVGWASKSTVTPIMEHFYKLKLSDSEIFKLAGVTEFADGDGWRKYADAKAAINGIQAAFDAELAGKATPTKQQGDSTHPGDDANF